MKEKIELNSEAINLRKDFGEDANSPIDIFSLIHNNDDLTIVFYPMSSRVSGICIRDGKNKIIGVNSTSTYGRQRFTIAHELYHLFFHEDFKRIVCSTDLEINKDPLEKEADMFASYFLAPYEALSYFIKNKLKKEKHQLDIEDVVKIEQYYGMSRQAILWRLVNDGYISREKADTMKIGIIASARRLGYGDKLYTPTPEDKQYATFGKYIKLAETLKGQDVISQGKYEELLLNGFRSDIIYGLDTEEEEVYD
ncbi:MAG: ImmA/IrrE family metallo-endopeptidase [Clostridiaceae bacterium]|nr:ImmA/IrrE family metallo-endopeptidase [Clostridiaceae bacterium]